MWPTPAQKHSTRRATQRGDPETSQAQASLPCIPLLLQTKQGHRVQSRRACIASGCGVSRGASSRPEKRTEGLKTIPVSRVTLCHANSPGQTLSQEGRGGRAGPAGPPWVTPCSPLSRLDEGPDASPGAGVLQPCSPASMAHAGQRLRLSRSTPCSLQPLQKPSCVGRLCLPSTCSSGAKGWGETLRDNPLCPVGWPRGL